MNSPSSDWPRRLVSDCLMAWRAMRANRVVVAVAVISLGVGIAATTTVFSVVDAIDLKLLPFQDSRRLVWVAEITPRNYQGCGQCPFLTSAGAVADWQQGTPAVESFAAYRSASLRWERGDVVSQLTARLATPNFFDILGVQPTVGRRFVPSDTLSGAEPVAILSNDLWRSKFGGDPNIVGTRQPLMDGGVKIIGVLHAEFRFDGNPEAWLPMPIDARSARNSRSLTVIGRLRPGASVGEANGQLQSVLSRLTEEEPATYRDWSVGALPLRSLLTLGRGENRMAVFIVTILVLVVGVLNVSGLLLSRAMARRQEFALRGALGATRIQLVRQVVAEGLCIGLLAVGVGLLLASLMLPLASTWFTIETSGVSVGIDYRAVVFAALIGVAAGAVASVSPALSIAKADLEGVVRDGSTRATGRDMKTRDKLAAGQVTVAFVLVLVAGVLSRHFLTVRYLDLGYDAHDLYFTTLVGDRGESKNFPAWRESISRTLEAVASTPGVIAASLEYRSAVHPSLVRPVGVSGLGNVPINPIVRAVDTQYFVTLRSRILKGRGFVADDNLGGAPVAIVNRTAAAQLWPGADPIGQHVFAGDSETSGETLTVIGVVADVERGELTERHWPMVYRPLAQAPVYHAVASLFVRADPRSMPSAAAAIEAAIRRSSHPGNPLESEEVRLSKRFLLPQVTSTVVGLFASFGLLLAVTGTYATVAFAATRRRREVGIRMALGATPLKVVNMLAGRQIAFAAVGILVGLMVLILSTGMLQSIAPGVRIGDPWTLAAAAAVSIAVVVVATWIPAWRITRIGTTTALKSD